jgi:hypothetical protein
VLPDDTQKSLTGQNSSLFKGHNSANKGNIVPKYAPHKSFCQGCRHYRYAYRQYALGNISTISGYFIISSDIDLANINLNYMCHTCSYDSYHLCYNPMTNNFTCNTPPHHGEHLCLIILKSLYAYRSFAQDKRFSMTSKCDLDLWPRDLVHVRDTPVSGEHFYEVSLKFLNACRRYAPDKNWTLPTCPPRGKL